MDDLTAFVTARLDEDEAAAEAATPGPWKSWIEGRDGRGGDSFIQTEGDRDLTLNFMPAEYKGKIPEWEADQDHIARHDPARALREVAAGREILELHEVHSEPTRWGDGERRGQPTGGTTYWCDECDHDRDYGHIGSRVQGCRTLLLLAAVWSDHPDYRPEWKP